MKTKQPKSCSMCGDKLTQEEIKMEYMVDEDISCANCYCKCTDPEER